MYVYVLAYLLFSALCPSWVLGVASARNQTVVVDFPIGAPPSMEPLQPLLVKQPVLRTLTYACDSKLEPAEFYYLCDIKKGGKLTVKTMSRALTNLARKYKFKRAHIILVPADGCADVHIALESYWTFNKLHVKGIGSGKDRLAQLYEQESGMPFDEYKHQESIKRIIAELNDQGYLAASITDELRQDERTKSFVVRLVVSRGRQHVIDAVSYAIADHDGHDCSDRPEFAEALQSLLLLEGKKYTAALVADYTKELKGQFEQLGYVHPTIQLSQQLVADEYAVSLHFTIQLPMHHRFVFQGNTFFTDAQLLQLMNAFGAMHELPPALLTAEIERLYRTHGFTNVHVEMHEKEQSLAPVESDLDENASAYALVNIQEGERAVIHQVKIQASLAGAHVVPGVDAVIPKGSFFEAESVQRGLEAIRTLYRSAGYWDVAIINQQFEAVSGTLSLSIDEGPRYYLQSLIIEQFLQLITEEPFAGMKIGEPLDYQSIQRQRTWLSDYLHRNGYMYAEVRPDITTTNTGTASGVAVAVKWKIGGITEPVQFGKIVVPGVCPIPFARLQQELLFQEGDTWSKEKMEDSVSRLRDLQLFSHIHVYPEQVAVPAAAKPIMLNVVPDDPFEFRLRAGVLGISNNYIWGDACTYKVGGSFLYKNVGRRGGILGVDADITAFEQLVAAYYRQPWLWNMRVITTTKGYSNKFTQPVMVGKRLPLYNVTQQGGVVGLQHKHVVPIAWIAWGQEAVVTFGANIGFEWVKTTLPNFNGNEQARLQHAKAAFAINFAPVLDGVKVPYFYVEPTIVLDRMDNKLNPTRGSFTVASLKCMASLDRKSTSFVKILAEHSWYIPIHQSAIFAFRIRGGHVFNQLFNRIMPPERFYLGGAQTLRGYNPDFVPPLGRYEDKDCRVVVPQGGRTMINVNAEVRFPLYQKLSGAIFQDAGGLFGDDFAAFIKERFVTATGFGLRYNTPIGPLRFDLGFKWRKPEAYEHRVAWFLALGHAY